MRLLYVFIEMICGLFGFGDDVEVLMIKCDFERIVWLFYVYFCDVFIICVLVLSVKIVGYIYLRMF